MKRVLPYFDVQAIVRFGIKPWSTWPHEYLANMKIDEASAIAFDTLYGSLLENRYLVRPIPKTVREAMDLPHVGGKQPLALQWFQVTQDIIRDAWVTRGPQVELTAATKGKGPLTAAVNITWTVTADGGLELNAADAWSYIRMACAADAAQGKLHVCRNPACETPYFREQRAGQIYCSHTCAVAMAVERFQAKKKKRGGAR